MRTSANNFIKIISTGFIVLTLLSLPLFWFRIFCDANLIENILPNVVILEPSSLVPDEIENDPNVTNHSQVNANFRNPQINNLGVGDYLNNISARTYNSNDYWLYRDSVLSDWEGIYFDKKTGHIVYHYNTTVKISENTKLKKEVDIYAGTKEVSEIPDKKLGRFYSPIIDGNLNYRSEVVVYDKKLRCFFKINFYYKSIVKGPQLSKDDTHKPIQIGFINKNQDMISLNWSPPLIPKAGSQSSLDTIVRNVARYEFRYLPVLDETGRIDLLDRETLEFAGTAGYLPALRRSLLAYEVLPLALDADQKYRGMYVASVNREGTALSLYVFNKEGKIAASETSRFTHYFPRGREHYIPTSTAIYFSTPWGPALTIAKYLLENLQPPILSVVSYFTADSFEASSGHRALFILPNSFIAMIGRDIEGSFAERFIYALLIILPSIILSIFLAWRVNKDAVVVGLSKNERLLWIIGTFASGLVGYITYRLTRPRETLVTCQNCGKSRKPDMDRCHRCNSKWHVPELTPPLWRVVG